jgi:hypothetical protein
VVWNRTMCYLMLPESSSAETMRNMRFFLPNLENTGYIGKGSKEIQGKSTPGIGEHSARICRAYC